LKQNIAIAVALLAIVAAFVVYEPEEQYRVYDCGMAEWHPDIPKSVKDECRRRALEHWREQQSKKIV
jgi:hypothetical protein